MARAADEPGRKMDPSHVSRKQSGDVRDDLAATGDLEAADADSAAAARDAAADARDLAAIADEIAGHNTYADAATARYWALRDRLQAAEDRVRASNMRNRAQADRTQAAKDRVTSSIDELTGAYRRDSGLTELARDLEASRRTAQTMILGFVDVDGLKLINDAFGHSAGDSTLQEVAKALRSSLRQYDLIVRYGGDEFLFSSVGMDEPEARHRLDNANQSLVSVGNSTITYGIVSVQGGETLPEAIIRADRALYAKRQ